MLFTSSAYRPQQPTPSNRTYPVTQSQTNAFPFLLPDEKLPKTEVLGAAGSFLNILIGFGLACSPFLVRKAKAYSGTKAGFVSVIPKTVMKRLSEQKSEEALFWRVGAVLSMASGLANYNTAVNTRQPSLLMNTLLGYLNTIGLLIWPQNLTLKAMIFVSWCFLAMGKQNDIDNSNHPEKRREWDLRQFIRRVDEQSPSGKTFGKTLREFSGFVAKDIRNTFNVQVWRDFFKNYDDKSSWRIPQSYFTAIAGQMFALSFISTLVSNRFKVKNISPVLVPVAGVIYNLPIMLRAWQNKHELESKAMLAAWPVALVGDGFRVSKTRNHLTGISNVSYLIGLGLEVNSKRYKKLLDYLAFYYQLAKLFPTLHAKDISDALTRQPDNLRQLEKQIGKSRTVYLLNLLKNAQQAEQNGLPLSVYLQPMNKFV